MKKLKIQIPYIDFNGVNRSFSIYVETDTEYGNPELANAFLTEPPIIEEVIDEDE